MPFFPSRLPGALGRVAGGSQVHRSVAHGATERAGQQRLHPERRGAAPGRHAHHVIGREQRRRHERGRYRIGCGVGGLAASHAPVHCVGRDAVATFHAYAALGSAVTLGTGREDPHTGRRPRHHDPGFVTVAWLSISTPSRRKLARSCVRSSRSNPALTLLRGGSMRGKTPSAQGAVVDGSMAVGGRLVAARSHDGATAGAVQTTMLASTRRAAAEGSRIG